MTARGSNQHRQRLPFRAGSGVEVELSWFALTDVGRRRVTNQDSYVTAPPVFAVADGMGGHSAGEIASAAVVRRLAELGGTNPVDEADIESALVDAVEDIELDAGESELGAGTTVTGVFFGDDPELPSWRVFNIGDSRVYHYYDGELRQLTVDHSVVQHLIDTGAISAEEAEFHPHANVITRAVGFNETPSPDFSGLELVAGQRLLICSDGLTKELTDIGIKHFLQHSETVEAAAWDLVTHALENAGRDNVTVIVLEVHAVEDHARPSASATGVDDHDTLEVPPLTAGR